MTEPDPRNVPPPGFPPPGSGPGYDARDQPGADQGYPPAQYGQQGYPPSPAPQPPYGAGQPAYSLHRSLHKPGTVALRPLALGDFFDSAFNTMRRNPKATIGMGAAVTAGFLLIPSLISVVLGFTDSLGGFTDTSPDSADQVGLALSSGVTSLFSFLANIVVAGMVVPVVTRATLGDKITASSAWRQSRGRLWRLVCLSLLEMVLFGVVIALVAIPVVLALAAGSTALAILIGIVGGLGALAALVGLHVKFFQLAAAAIVVEKRGVFSALGRAGRLARGQFWRILGIMLLVMVVAGFAGQILQIPFAIVGAVLGVVWDDSSWGAVAVLLTGNIASVLVGAIVAPFTGIVSVLQYLDQRFRKEGFDIELINHVQARRDGS